MNTFSSLTMEEIASLNEDAGGSREISGTMASITIFEIQGF